MNTEPATAPIHSMLLFCARPAQDAAASERILALAKTMPDWPGLLAAAAQHGVAPLLCRRLSVLRDGALPELWREQFREEFARNTRRNLVLTAELFRILAALETGGVCAIAYKGPVLAARAYADIALRQFADLDIVVPQSEIAEAHSALASLGYRSAIDPSKVRNSHFIARGTAGQHSFSRAGGLSTVELHTEKTLRYLPKPLDWRGLRARLQQIQFGGGSARTFSLEDTLCLLSVHGAKHFWGRLGWICDISQLMRLTGGLDWEATEKIARQMRCWKMVLLGTAIANTLLDAPLPENAQRAIQKDSAVQTLCRRVCADFALRPGEYPGIAQRLNFRLRSYDSLSDGLRQTLRVATQPTEEDWEAVPLPRALEPLYALVRPWRLLRRHGLGLEHRTEADSTEFVPIPAEMADRMLRFADFSSDDRLYDLGCGDGSVVIAAAKKFGIPTVGVDIDPQRISEARANATRNGVSHLVEFRQQDARETDLTSATVVTMHLGIAGNLAILKKLRSELRSGARIVSRDFPIPVWTPDDSDELEGPGNLTTTLFLWRI